jgi:protein TonB
MQGRNKEMQQETWRTAIYISLALHALFFFAALQIGNTQAFYEPKPIEVELGALSDGERQTDVSPKAAPPGVKASPVTPHHDAVPRDAKQAVATAAEPAPPAPAAVKEVPETVTITSPTGTVESRGSTDESRPDVDNSATSAAANHPAAASGNAAHTGANATAGTLPSVISGPVPVYPADARSKGWTGKVRVRVLISEQGTVKDAVIAVSSGHASLDDAALKGLRRWLFRPAYKDGRAVVAWVAVPVLFKLN